MGSPPILDPRLLRSYTLFHMNKRSIGLYAGTAWQIVRFAAIAGLVFLHVNPSSAITTSVLLVWPGVSQLAVAVALLFLARDFERYRQYRNLIILAKFLEAFPGFLLLVLQALALFIGVSLPLQRLSALSTSVIAGAEASAITFYYALIVIVLLDLILLLFLLSLKEQSVESRKDETSNLPELEETTLEDE